MDKFKRTLTEEELEWFVNNIRTYHDNELVTNLAVRLFYSAMLGFILLFVVLAYRSNNGSDR